MIYAELRGEEPVAHDRTQLYDLFDFVTAMDAFFSTGTAQKLKSYLWSEGEKDPVLHTLLTRINQFSEDPGAVPGAEIERRSEPDRSGAERNAQEEPEPDRPVLPAAERPFQHRVCRAAFLRRKALPHW